MKTILLISLLYSFSFGQEFWFPDSLNEIQLLLLDSIANDFTIDDGCEGSIADTRNSIACPEANTFYNMAAWFIQNEKPADYVVDKLRRHNDTYYKPDKYTLAPSTMTIAGDTTSPINIVAYISSTCSHCKRVGIPLQELVEGLLYGQASFVLKPIHHKIGDYALLAAANQGKDWDLFIAMGNITTRIDEDAVVKAATMAGIDVERLKKDVSDNNDLYKKIITENHEEAKRNGMNFTPALYFNGYRYRSNKHPLWMIDYIKYLTRTGILN